MLRPFISMWRTATLRPCSGGLVVGIVFWAMSLTPTLMPRTAVTQAAISGLCLAIGYGIGAFAGGVVHRVLRRRDVTLPDAARPTVRRSIIGCGILVGLGGPVFWLHTQRMQRSVLTMNAPATWGVAGMLLGSLLIAGVFVVAGRGVRGVARLLDRLLGRVVPERASSPVSIALVIVLVLVVVWPAARGTFAGWANDSFGLVDTTTSPETRPPTEATVSGSPQSLVDWDDLGRHGRDFVAQATPTAELQAIGASSTPVVRPIRVYAGLESAAENRTRADLAVRELERTGAFDRQVLAVVTSTGSGWVDPDAATALETLYGGDTAIVSQQYSFLPSWIATLLEPEASGEAASALFEAVHARWERLPADQRPKLLVFGLSLGSYGTEQAFAGPTAETSVANLTSRTDGVLLVGPTASNPIWRQLTDGRDPGSPVWRPVVDDGAVVRFDGRSPTLRGIDADWVAPRVLYVQHPSDPVTFWDPSWFVRKPPAMKAPRGDGVIAGTWFPIVTGVQGVFDLMAGFGAPPGFGHDYRLDYVRAWAQVAPPEGWTDADTVALEDRLHGE